MNNIKQALQCAVCDGTGAVLFYDKYGIGDSKPCVACKKVWFENSNKEIAELKAENKQIDTINASLKSHINVLREAFEEIDMQLKNGFVRCKTCGDQENTKDFDCRIWIADALASTPAQSMIQHDNEVIERCAVECEQLSEQYTNASTYYACAKGIRELKGKL